MHLPCRPEHVKLAHKSSSLSRPFASRSSAGRSCPRLGIYRGRDTAGVSAPGDFPDEQIQGLPRKHCHSKEAGH
eukprot:3871129-Alexandrium_andersonii.AAC.1